MKAAIQTTVRSTSVSFANASWPIARAVSPTPQRYRVPAITSSGWAPPIRSACASRFCAHR